MGRWSRPIATPLNERKCSTCNVLEDEFHFLFECILYNSIRTKYISAYFRRHSNMSKFIELLSSDNETVVRKLSMYIQKAFFIRNNENYQYQE